MGGLLLGRRQEEGGLKLDILELPSSAHSKVRIDWFLNVVKNMLLPRAILVQICAPFDGRI